MRALELSMPFIEMNPQAADVFNHDEVLRHAGFITGLATKLYKTPEEIEEMRAQRAQQEQQMMMMEQNESAANTINKLASVNQGQEEIIPE
jgi:hypothetical protein